MRSARIYQKLNCLATQRPTYIHEFTPLMKAHTASLLLHMFFGTEVKLSLGDGGGGKGPVSNVSTWLAFGTLTLQSLL